MSVESTEALERSVLESKDREQLLAIAAALGVKATSRAKKADIIAKILEQTSGRDAPSAAAPSSSAPAGPRPRNGNGRATIDETDDGDTPAAAESGTTLEPAVPTATPASPASTAAVPAPPAS